MSTILFDMDGTLFDTEKMYHAAWKETINHFGYEISKERLLKLRSFGRPFCIEQFKEWYGQDFDYPEVLKYRRALVNDMLDEQGIPLKPDVCETLEELRKRGHSLSVVTATYYERAAKNLEETGLLKYFDRVICATMVEKGKPAPDVYQYACSELGIDPQEAYAVEDSPNGVMSAYKAGCRVIMIPDLSEATMEDRACCIAVAKGLPDLIDITK